MIFIRDVPTHMTIGIEARGEIAKMLNNPYKR